MILQIRHRGLKRLYERDDASGLNATHVEKLSRILARLDRASRPEHMDLPGWRLHPPRGELAGFWSVTVSANWRVVFRFDDGNTTDIDYLDYH